MLYSILFVDTFPITQGSKYPIPIHPFLATLESKSASFWHDHVRHICLGYLSDDDTAPILSKCTGILSLAIFHGGPGLVCLPFMGVMPLVRLSTSLGRLFGSDEGVDFDHPLFAHLTHLEVFDSAPHDSWSTGFRRIPSLTHLSFNFPHDWLNHRLFIDDVLAHCAVLDVFVLIADDDDYLSGLMPRFEYFADDPRCVLLTVKEFLEDWEIGVEGGTDYWVRAERFIQQRRSGEIKGESLTTAL